MLRMHLKALLDLIFLFVSKMNQHKVNLNEKVTFILRIILTIQISQATSYGILCILFLQRKKSGVSMPNQEPLGEAL